MENKNFLNIREAAKFLEVHIETFRRWDREGKLTAIRVGKSNHRRNSRKSLEKFKSGDFHQKANESNHPPSIYADRIIDFHSSAVPDAHYFTRLVLAIAERFVKLVDCELIDGPHDKKRNIL
jgi:excisionase family DNA binding protein